MHVFQTDGVPPSRGRTIFAIMGSTRNNSVALTNRVPAKSQGKELSSVVLVFAEAFSWRNFFFCDIRGPPAHRRSEETGRSLNHHLRAALVSWRPESCLRFAFNGLPFAPSFRARARSRHD